VGALNLGSHAGDSTAKIPEDVEVVLALLVVAADTKVPHTNKTVLIVEMYIWF
jgi:hypothetical protein